ncbi:MAG: glycosyl hydrolase [Planctomycetota bacterium]
MNRKRLNVGLSIVVMFLTVTAVSHAGTWTVRRNVAAADVPAALLTGGTLVKASNLGGGGAVTIGGVAFDANTGNVVGASNAATAYYSGADADLTALLNTQARTYSTTTPATISFTGLTVGKEYRMQMVTGWAWGWLKYRLTGAQGQTVNLNWKDGDDNPGINIATYIWTADASTATFEFLSTQTNGDWKPADVHAYSLYQDTYEIYSAKKGIGSAASYGGDRIEAMHVGWYYNWNILNINLHPSIEYVPMRHSKWWPDVSELANVGTYHNSLCWNEPYHYDGTDPTPEEADGRVPSYTAITWAEWANAVQNTYAPPGITPRLGSPTAKNSTDGWMDVFMGYDPVNLHGTDFISLHQYPSSGNLLSQLQNKVDGVYSAWGLPVWITEFNVADWSLVDPTATHEKSYTDLCETLHWLESDPRVECYAIFPWSPEEDPPGTLKWPAGHPSYVYEADGQTLTPLGKLYAEYRSSDINGPYTQVWYYLHNKNSHMRLYDNAGTPSVATVYTEGDAVEFELIDAGGGYCYIDNKITGYRLRCTGSAVEWGTSANTGTWAQWSLADAGNGWKYIQNREYPKRLSSSGSSLTVEDASQEWASVKWAFPRSGNEYIEAPTGLTASAGSSVSLDWEDSGGASYNIYRSETSGEPYTLIATDIETNAYIDDSPELAYDTPYYYVVTAVDTAGSESANSNEAVIILYAGDLTFDGRVDTDDLAKLSIQWLSPYDMTTFQKVASDWLKTQP